MWLVQVIISVETRLFNTAQFYSRYHTAGYCHILMVLPPGPLCHQAQSVLGHFPHINTSIAYRDHDEQGQLLSSGFRYNAFQLGIQWRGIENTSQHLGQ